MRQRYTQPVPKVGTPPLALTLIYNKKAKFTDFKTQSPPSSSLFSNSDSYIAVATYI